MKTTVIIVVDDEKEESAITVQAAKEKPKDDLTQVLEKIGEVIKEVQLLRGRVGMK